MLLLIRLCLAQQLLHCRDMAVRCAGIGCSRKLREVAESATRVGIMAAARSSSAAWAAAREVTVKLTANPQLADSSASKRAA
jgi:hypothetical protein